MTVRRRESAAVEMSLKTTCHMRRLLLAATFALTLLLAVGCGKDDTDDGGITIVDPDAEPPVIERFWFDTRNNPRMSSNVTCRIDAATHAITGSVDGATTAVDGMCTFSPTFTVPEGQTVYVNGTRQWSGVSRVDFSSPVTYRVENVNGEAAEYVVTLSFSFTGLPVVSISTASGMSVTSKDTWSKATITIDGVGLYDDLAASDIEIAGRGNSTWTYPKKPYKFKFSKRTGVLGMPEHKRWVLLANYIDRTLLRNDVAFYLGQHSSLAWTPHGVFVELFINGEHRGCYYLCEQIRIDENRLNINEMPPYSQMADGADISGGYILELDSYYDEVNKFRSAVKGLPVNVNTPDENDIGSRQFIYIRDYFNEAETVLYSDYWLDPERGYKNYIDILSFADMYLISELIYHYEWIHPKSTYMYKDRGGKLCAGPMWDYDWLTFTLEYGWHCRSCLWYPRLFEDPEFRALLKQRWQELYPVFVATGNYISSQRKMLAKSAQVDWKLWANTISPNGDQGLSYEAAVNQMSSRLSSRLAWLNEMIRNLE